MFSIIYWLTLKYNSLDTGANAVAVDRMSEANVTHLNNLSIGTQTNKYGDLV